MGDVIDFTGQRFRVSFAKPLDRLAEKEKSNCLHIQGFPKRIQRKSIHHGLLELAPNNMPQPREIVQPKAYNTQKAFVYFDSHEQALKARGLIHGRKFNKYYTLSADLAIPLPTERRKKLQDYLDKRSSRSSSSSGGRIYSSSESDQS